MRTESTSPRRLTTDDVLSIVDDVLGKNPWVRLGVSAAVGLLVGIVGGGRVVRAGARLAFAAGARHAARYAFDVAFDTGQRHAAQQRQAAAERSY